MTDITYIAEIGSNWYYPGHIQDKKAEIMRSINSTADAGANVAKFQLFVIHQLFSKIRVPKLYHEYEKYQLPLGFLGTMSSHASACKVELWCSVFSVELVHQASMFFHGFKIASGDITNLPLIEAVARASKISGKPMCISTGAATIDEIDSAIKLAKEFDPYKLILFHCVSAYPAPIERANLSAGLYFRDRVDAIGFSDHTKGSFVASVAATLGYTYFEKHFHSSSALPDLPDRSVSISEDEFKEYIKDIEMAIKIVGDGNKKIWAEEVKERIMARRGADGLRPNTTEPIKEFI